MNYRALALGVCIGFLVALSPACGEPECGPANCNGCCSAEGVCTDSATQNAQACGAGGNTCTACTGAETCNAGVCTPPTTGTPDSGTTGECGNKCPNSDGTCSNVTCTSGCCGLTAAGAPQCKGGAEPTACGQSTATKAVACENCATTNEQCVSKGGTRSCEPALEIGKTCTQDTDCASLGAGGICKLNIGNNTDGGVAYPGGYCTLDCGVDATVCGNNAFCWPFPDLGNLFGENQSLCLNNCDPRADTNPECRENYTCVNWDGTFGGCFPRIAPAPGTIGDACAGAADCDRNATDTFCYPETYKDEQMVTQQTGFTGGYCMAGCEPTEADPNAGCTETDICLNLGSNTNPFLTCMQLCDVNNPAASGCRPEYKCDQLSSGGMAIDAGICFPNCLQPNFECSPEAQAAGYTCQDTGDRRGFCCADFADGGTDCF